MACAIGVHGTTHHQKRRPPLIDECADLAPSFGGIGLLDRLERLRRSGQAIADGQTNAPTTKVKRQDAVRLGRLERYAQALPAAARKAGLIPRIPNARIERCSTGVSKMTAESAGTVSQELRLSSLSS